MLTFDALVEQAKIRNMPHRKFRGILREYLQILILKNIYKNKLGKKLFFTGGTCLRLINNLKRFSEDLDFDTKGLTKIDFEKLLEGVKIELKRLGLDLSVEFDYWNNVYSSRLIFPSVESSYDYISHHSKKTGIVIKVETNKSNFAIKSETEIITGYGEIFPVVCTERSILFSNKIDAFLKKPRGRHIYDLIFLLSQNYPFNDKYLKNLGLRTDPLKLIKDKIYSFSQSELEKSAENLRPFLFDESEAALITDAKTIIPKLVEKYK